MVHSRIISKKIKVGLVAFCLLLVSSLAQAQLIAAEYFLNIDPGEGAATSIASPIDGSFNGNIEQISLEVDISALGVGQHVAFVRFQESGGKWGMPKGIVFTINNDQELIFAVTEAEYYFNNDPGEGNGTPFMTATDGSFGDYLETVSEEVQLNGLQEGSNVVYVRFKDANGAWSVPRGQSFQVDNRAEEIATIRGAEYFINTDPGPGNGTMIAAPVDGIFDEKIEDIDLDITLNGLSAGKHTVFTRFQKSNGSWGAKRGFTFSVADGEEESLTITGAEFFVNEDPGEGNGTALVSPVDGAFDEAVEELAASFDVTSYGVGRHFAYFRVRGSNGKWGPARGVPFLVENIVFINQAEYFFDSDPGQGKGTPITVSKDGNFDSALEEIELDIDLSESGLAVGEHTLYVRFKNTKGEWSAPSSRKITLETRPTIALSVDTLRFDDTVVGDSLSQTFTVRNEGDGALEITNITSSLPDYKIRPTTGSIPANSDDELTFTVTYLPVSGGAKNAVLTVLNNDRNETIQLEGQAIPREPIMQISALDLDFGNVLVGDSVAKEIAIYNTGYDVLTLSDITVSSAEYRVSPASGSLNAGQVLTDSLVITVSLVPQSEGTKTATLSLAGNVPTQQVSLTGEAQLNPEPTIAVNSDSLGFGSVEIASSKEVTLQIRNLGTNALSITSLTVQGEAFSSTQSTPISIERGTPLSVPITFSPETATSFSGSVVIVSNDASNSTYTIQLSGEGTVGPPQKLLSINPDSVDFGLVTVNETAAQTLTVINSGNATLKITGISSDNSAFGVNNAPSSSQPLFIGAEESADITLSFSPSQGGGQLFRGRLAISSDRTDSSDPLTFTVKGTGVDEPTPNILLSTRQLNFGELKLGEQKTLSFTITNSGNANLNVSDIFANEEDFTLLTPSNPTFLLAPNNERTVEVKFEPSEVRTYTNLLSITSNIATEQVGLLGSGVTLSSGVDSTQVRDTDILIEAGQSVPLTINPTGLGNSGSVNVYYKSGGGGSVASYTKRAMQRSSGGAYSFTIPQNLSSSNGISYWFEVTDGNETVTSPEVNPNLNPYTISVSIANGLVRNAPQPAGTEQNFYRLISVPLVQTSGGTGTVLNNFGDANTDSWRLFRWQSGAYVEHTESGFESFSPGRAYWFITTTAASLQSGEGISAPTDEKFSIFLQPGWNMIGSPFTYSTTWEEAEKPESVENLWAYNGSEFVNATSLRPWEGYFVNNNSNNPVELKLSALETGSGNSKQSGVQTPFWDEYWSIQLSAETGLISDTYNFAGVHEDARFGVDEMDLTNAPNQPGEFLSIGFENAEHTKRKLAVDARAPHSDGHYWDISLNSNTSNEHISLRALVNGSIPDGFIVRLFDLDQETVWALDQTMLNKRTLRSGLGAEISRKFRLVVGTEEFINENDLGINERPAEFVLKNNYPNPFNPSTTIVFGLPENARVTLEIFNTLGRRVATLINKEMQAGYHDLIWDASNVASGVYFYRITAQSTTSNLSFSKLQKMTLIK